MNLARFLAIPAVWAFTLSFAADGGDQHRITIDEAAQCLGLSAQQMAEVRAGKIVSTDFPELTDKELAITVAMLVDLPIADLAEAVRGSELLESNPNFLLFEDLGDEDPSEADFVDVEFDGDEASEIRGLLGAKPGSEFNLSAEEILGFEGLRKRFPGSCERDPECPADVVQEYRRVLLDRLRAYRRGGTEAVAPYARGGGSVASPGEELRTAAQGCALIRDRLPELHRALVDYPRSSIEGFEHRFFWVKQRVRDRPAFVLKHGMLYQRPDALLGVEREFYVGHSYNSLLVMAGCLPLENQTLVFYINRTSTDQVAGVAKDMRHSMGRKHMRAQVVTSLEKIRAEIENGAE